jgi:hypothetical protein
MNREHQPITRAFETEIDEIGLNRSIVTLTVQRPGFPHDKCFLRVLIIPDAGCEILAEISSA